MSLTRTKRVVSSTVPRATRTPPRSATSTSGSFSVVRIASARSLRLCALTLISQLRRTPCDHTVKLVRPGAFALTTSSFGPTGTTATIVGSPIATYVTRATARIVEWPGLHRQHLRLRSVDGADRGEDGHDQRESQQASE